MTPSGGDQTLSYEFDPRSLLRGFEQVNKARADFEKGVEGSAGRLDKALTSVYDNLIKSSSRAEQAQQRYVRSIEQSAAAYGRTGVDKLIAQRDAIIKRLGDEEKLVARVTAAYSKMIAVERQRGAGSGTGGGLSGNGSGVLALRGIRDLFEGRTSYGEVQLGKSLAGLTGTAAVVGGITAAFAGLAIAGFKATESLAAYGTEIRDIELRTGLTTKEVSQFSYVAKTVGMDVQVVDRMMRGLSEAVADVSPAGQKARETLSSLGVSTRDLEGNLRPTGTILLEISQAFAKLPPGIQLSKDAMDLFKRIGIETVPLMRELSSGVKDFNEKGLPSPTSDDVERWAGYNKQLQGAAAWWAEIGREIKDIGARAFIGVTGMLSGAPSPRSNIGEATAADIARDSQEDRIAQAGGRSAMSAAGAAFGKFLSGGQGIEGAQHQLTDLKKKLDDLRTSGEQLDRNNTLPEVFDKQRKAIEAATAAYDRQQLVVKNLNKSQSEQLAITEALRKLQISEADRVAHPYGMLKADQELLTMARMPGITPGQVATAQGTLAPQRLQEIQQNITKAMDKQRDEMRKLEGLPSLEAIRAEALPQTKSTGFLSIASGGPVSEKQMADQLHGMEESVRLAKELLDVNRKNDEQAAEAQAKVASALAPNSLQNRLATEQQIANIKIRAADEEYSEAVSLADKQTDQFNKETALYVARLKHVGEVAKAQAEADEQHAGEIRKQMDEIQKVAESLATTLFLHPDKFGKQLLTTMRDAALKPITSGIGEMAASALHPLIFGASGTAGLAGAMHVFGSGTGKPRILADGSALVTVTNPGGGTGAGGGTVSYGGGGPWYSQLAGHAAMMLAPGFMQAVGGGGGGGSLTPSVSSSIDWTGGGSSAGGGSVAGGVPYSPAAMGTSLGAFGGGGGGGGAGAEALAAVMGLSPAMRKSMLSSTGGLNNPLKAITGAFGGSAWANSQSSIGSNVAGWLNPSTTAAGRSTALQALSRGPFTGTPVGGLAASGGIALSEAGLLGNNRGTGAGIAEGAAGGFLVAGPIGAAVGASIGLGEMLAGVQSPRNEAKQLVKQTYGIGISNAEADKIVDIANQSYAGRVSIAVRSPEVRQMLGLYAAGTGQAAGQARAMSADTPHGASFVETGGRLTQQSTYQYGAAFTQASAFPVMGSVPGGTYPGGGGPSQVSLNLSGSSVDAFIRGQMVTPDYVANQQASAWDSSTGRTSSAMTMQEAGSIVS